MGTLCGLEHRETRTGTTRRSKGITKKTSKGMQNAMKIPMNTMFER